MDKNLQMLNFAQGDLFKAIVSLEDNIKDSIRELNIYKDVYKDYIKKDGAITEDIKIFNDRVEFILNELYNFKSKVFE